MASPLSLRSGTRTADRGLAQLFRVLSGQGGKVKVGVLGSKAAAPKREAGGETSGQTLVSVAAVHEFGLGHVTKRSFLHGFATKHAPEIKDDVRKIVRLIVAGRYTPEQALKILGVKWAADVQEFIRDSSNFQPLDPRTIKRKGSSSALIHTGQLRSSISSEVVKK